MKDLRQSPMHAKYMERMGWIVEKKDGVNYFIKKLPFIGSFIKIQRPKTIDLSHIEKLRRKYKAFQIIIEPELVFGDYSYNSLRINNFKLCKSPFLPSKTIFIDLTKSKNTLLREMHPKTRYNIKMAEKNKIKITKSCDIEMFINFWHICHKKRLLFLSQAKQIREMYKSFKNNADILIATKDTFPVAALFLLYYDKVTYYMYAAADNEGRGLFAPTLITWKAILFAKKRGSSIFDFEGIYDERFPIKSWVGFTRFKKGFGGKEIIYPGGYVKNYFPFLK